MLKDDKERLFTLIAAIPPGQVASMAGLPRQARAVGRLLKHLPKDSRLPWHRVINSQGKISFPADSEQYTKQKMRLEAEGVIFVNDKVNMRVFNWQP